MGAGSLVLIIMLKNQYRAPRQAVATFLLHLHLDISP